MDLVLIHKCLNIIFFKFYPLLSAGSTLVSVRYCVVFFTESRNTLSKMAIAKSLYTNVFVWFASWATYHKLQSTSNTRQRKINIRIMLYFSASEQDFLYLLGYISFSTPTQSHSTFLWAIANLMHWNLYSIHVEFMFGDTKHTFAECYLVCDHASLKLKLHPYHLQSKIYYNKLHLYYLFLV